MNESRPRVKVAEQDISQVQLMDQLMRDRRRFEQDATFDMSIIERHQQHTLILPGDFMNENDQSKMKRDNYSDDEDDEVVAAL